MGNEKIGMRNKKWPQSGSSLRDLVFRSLFFAQGRRKEDCRLTATAAPRGGQEGNLACPTMHRISAEKVFFRELHGTAKGG